MANGNSLLEATKLASNKKENEYEKLIVEYFRNLQKINSSIFSEDVSTIDKIVQLNLREAIKLASMYSKCNGIVECRGDMETNPSIVKLMKTIAKIRDIVEYHFYGQHEHFCYKKMEEIYNSDKFIKNIFDEDTPANRVMLIETMKWCIIVASSAGMNIPRIRPVIVGDRLPVNEEQNIIETFVDWNAFILEDTTKTSNSKYYDNLLGGEENAIGIELYSTYLYDVVSL